ncbi:SDR family NAD(P)-dependent oxidoreductase [Thiopseudomonas acetoxidans]|uniref:SDR family NAD(P)-dependent oxidoreductase n=1 Tax=Thiopseudomonas acetoxidans TaxID=3041622 RepID=A0ABT7SRV1_9GAMM|nr:SDR family NAD(P)-dependent oxidoreductase [Thiopseudomonas sp. CY1220]MDM7858931.1 SDR family NAD(P)-dependent oxidoreductase [Thiopseudomonas sp. CY1220]
MNNFILTGINRGLGKALSKELQKNFKAEDKKIFISRKELPNNTINPSTEHIQMDLSKNDIELDWISLGKQTRQVIFINNASVIEPICKASDLSMEELNKAMNVNFKSPFKIAQRLTRETQRFGIELLIFNITTGAAIRPIQGWFAYCTSKATIKMALDVLSKENDHVKVIHFDPGVMDTDMQKVIRSSSKAQMPDVELFLDLKRNSELKSPTDIAKNICDAIKKEIL